MLFDQDVDQIRDSATQLVRALEIFQTSHLNLLGSTPDDVQSVRLARLFNRIGITAARPAVATVKPPKVVKPRKAYKARKPPQKKVPQRALTKEEQHVLRIMPLKDFQAKSLVVPKPLQGRKLVAILIRLHKLGYIRRVKMLSDQTSLWQLTGKR